MVCFLNTTDCCMTGSMFSCSSEDVQRCVRLLPLTELLVSSLLFSLYFFLCQIHIGMHTVCAFINPISHSVHKHCVMYGI